MPKKNKMPLPEERHVLACKEQIFYLQFEQVQFEPQLQFAHVQFGLRHFSLCVF